MAASGGVEKFNEARPMGERVASLEAWTNGHEKICGDRYRILLGVVSIGMMIILAVSGWGLSKVFSNLDDQTRLLQSAVAEVNAPAAATYLCADGSYSAATNPQGACSSHGGIYRPLGDEGNDP